MIHQPVEFKIGDYLVPVDLYRDNGRIFFLYGYNPGVNKEIKMMERRVYHGYAGAPMRDYVLEHFKKDKLWSAPETEHNEFQIDFLTGKKPYAIYKKPLESFKPHYDVLRNYQMDMAQHMVTRRRALIHGDRGIGKTLAFFEAAQQVQPENIWYISSTSGIRSTKKQIVTWDMRIPVECMTYRGLVSRVRSLEGQEFVPPQMVCFDEIHNGKSPTAQRSEAAYMLAMYVRQYWGDDAYLIGMSGTTSPASPLDYWMQARILCPGYLIEGEYSFLRERLAITEEQDYGTGVHKKIVAWKDHDNVCEECGQPRDDPAHFKGDVLDDDDDYHEFKRAKNEVAFLSRRLIQGGLMMVKLKDECEELPEKQFDEIILQPSQATLDIARTLAESAPSSAQALMRVRALSDGFQYHEVQIDETVCPICKGTCEALDFILKSEFEGSDIPDPPGGDETDEEWQRTYFNQEMLPCIRCDGSGKVGVFERQTLEVATPKDGAFRDMLDDHEDDGRLVAYAGFQGSVDRIVRIACDMGWDYIQADGRGWRSSVAGIPDLILPNGKNEGPDYEGLFQKEYKGLARKLVFCGQPGAAGEGISLTASRSLFNYSLTFNAKDYLQSQDRIHRIGMDTNRGATIWNCFHLPTDRIVFNNLEEKIARQDLTIGLDVDMAEILGALR